VILLAFAAERRAAVRRAAGHWRPPLSIDISCPLGAHSSKPAARYRRLKLFIRPGKNYE